MRTNTNDTKTTVTGNNSKCQKGKTAFDTDQHMQEIIHYIGYIMDKMLTKSGIKRIYHILIEICFTSKCYRQIRVHENNIHAHNDYAGHTSPNLKSCLGLKNGIATKQKTNSHLHLGSSFQRLH